MPLDSDIYNADEQLQVEFYLAKEVDPKWDGKPFVRINIPGDKTTIIEQPMTLTVFEMNITLPLGRASAKAPTNGASTT